MAVPTPPGSKKKEIYKYIAPWTVYGMNWSVRQDKRFRIAFGSFIEDYSNKVSVGAELSGTVTLVSRSQTLQGVWLRETTVTHSLATQTQPTSSVRDTESNPFWG